MLIPDGNWTDERFPIKFSDGESVCGKLLISVRTDCNGSHAEIWNVEISEQIRGRGLGQQMMKECLDFIKDNLSDCVGVFLLVRKENERARHIYEKLGFSYTADPNQNRWALPMEIPMKNLIGE